MLSEESKKARAEYQREYRKRNASRLRAYKRKWSKDNPEKINQYQENYWSKKAALEGSENVESEGTRFSKGYARGVNDNQSL